LQPLNYSPPVPPIPAAGGVEAASAPTETKTALSAQLRALEMISITKVFPGVTALSGVDFDVYPGEVHALMGENGAGKSTLMKILSGVYSPTNGELRVGGTVVTFSGPAQAREAGIAIIHQEFNLFPNLSAAENIFIDRSAFADSFGRIAWKQMQSEAERVIQSIGGRIDVREEVQHLSVHSQQVLEIAKAISAKADILVMDEPSAALPENEVEKMFAMIRELKKNRVAIIYVSHRIYEVFQIADRVTVLRDGRKAGTRRLSETSEAEVIRMMIGKDVGNLYSEKVGRTTTDVVLQVSDLELNQERSISFETRRGEILALFGLIGSGNHTVAERLFGLKAGRGAINIDGHRAFIRSPRDAVKHGIAYVPADRHRHGLIKAMTVLDNVSLVVLSTLSRLGWIDGHKERELGERYRQTLNIKTPSVRQATELLSGGNQQKIVLAKWLAATPKVLILEEPTRGVDIGAKQEIYRLIREIAATGFGIILISSEIPEVLGLSDRILVLYDGRLVWERAKSEASHSALLHAASGLTEQAPHE
jgi:inositol transport system ATP-binding protein